MLKKQLKRVNKSKKEIVSSIQLTQDAERRRALIKDIIFPYLIKMNDTIGYSKVFLQAFSGLVNGVMEEQRKVTTLAHINNDLVDKLDTVFKVSDPEQKKEYDRYVALINLLQDISVQDLTYAAELPRYIDGFFSSKTDKGSINEVDIIKILGK